MCDPPPLAILHSGIESNMNRNNMNRNPFLLALGLMVLGVSGPTEEERTTGSQGTVAQEATQTEQKIARFRTKVEAHIAHLQKLIQQESALLALLEQRRRQDAEIERILARQVASSTANKYSSDKTSIQDGV